MIIKAPNKIPVSSKKSVFLAGAIDMGKAIDWQTKTSIFLNNAGWDVYNPRRDDWDSSWVQSIDNPQFCQQVEWELDALERANRIIVYFPEGSKAPISLLELGLHMKSGKLVVCAPDEYERSGNVHITCRKYGVPVFKDLNKAVGSIILDL